MVTGLVADLRVVCECERVCCGGVARSSPPLLTDQSRRLNDSPGRGRTQGAAGDGAIRRFARKQSKTFPAEIPANMIIRSYQPKELVQLYRDANVVVVSMLPNKYAGITTLIEGLACRRPVVATRTRGLVDYLTPTGGISVVEPGDSAAMRTAIVRLLEHPEEALAQAQTGYESVERLYDFDRYIETIASRLESL